MCTESTHVSIIFPIFSWSNIPSLSRDMRPLAQFPMPSVPLLMRERIKSFKRSPADSRKYQIALAVVLRCPEHLQRLMFRETYSAVAKGLYSGEM